MQQETDPERVHSFHRLSAGLDGVYMLALGVWAGALLMVGATAAITFPRMAQLDPRLPGFESFEGEHHRIAAGQVMNLAFTVSDWVGLVAMAVAAACLGAVFVFRRRSSDLGPALVVRSVAMGLLVVLTLFSTLAFRPSLNRSFEQLWTAAAAGENERADEIRERLAPRHAKASFLLTTQFALVLAAGAAGAFDSVASRRDGLRGAGS